jgi:hypothetical protein
LDKYQNRIQHNQFSLDSSMNGKNYYNKSIDGMDREIHGIIHCLSGLEFWKGPFIRTVNT